MSEFPFRFERHPKKKGVCPQCGHKGQFRFYEDYAGNRLSAEFGKCERFNSCGYHKIPTMSQNAITNILDFQEAKNQNFIFPNQEWNDKFDNWLRNNSSNFHKYWLNKGIPQDHFLKHGVATDNQGKTVFIYRNNTGRIVNAKWLSYGTNGHREKGKDSPNSYSMTQPKDGKSKYGMCLYGEELLDQMRNKTAIVVESEKTKVIASFYYPDYDWLACGANNGLTDDKISALFGRKVIWLCDADKAGRENSSIKNLKVLKLTLMLLTFSQIEMMAMT